MAKNLKKTSDKYKIMFIGSHVSALPMDVLSKDFIDFISINEGVITLKQLIKTNFKIEDLKKVNKQISDVRESMSKSERRLIRAAYKDIDIARRMSPEHQFVLDEVKKQMDAFASVYSSLGCKFGCNFCMINIVNRTSIDPEAKSSDFKIMRHWDPIFFVDQLEILANYGVKTIRLSDEMFFLNKKY